MTRHFSLNSSLLDTELEFKFKVSTVDTSNSKLNYRTSAIEFETINPKLFFLNIQLLDSELPRILAELLLLGHKHFKSKTSDLLVLIENENPIGYKQEKGHPFYKKKLGDFLYCLATGMNSKTKWDGYNNSDFEFVFEKKNSENVSFNIYDRIRFQEYLIDNTKFELVYTGLSAGSSDNSQKTKGTKAYYERLDEEAGQYFVKLQIRFI